jgi:hypothetical protein
MVVCGASTRSTFITQSLPKRRASLMSLNSHANPSAASMVAPKVLSCAEIKDGANTDECGRMNSPGMAAIYFSCFGIRSHEIRSSLVDGSTIRGEPARRRSSARHPDWDPANPSRNLLFPDWLHCLTQSSPYPRHFPLAVFDLGGLSFASVYASLPE